MSGLSALHKACYKGNVNLVQEIIAKDPKLVEARDARNATPLHYASFRGHVDVVDQLIKNGSPIDAVDEEGTTPLQSASFAGKPRCVSILLSSGANPEHRDIDQRTALHKAAFNGHVEVIQALMEKKINLDPEDVEGSTPIQQASFYNRISALAYLADYGAKVNSKDVTGSTALHKAAYAGNEEIVKYLIEKRADLNSKDQDESTPLHASVYNGHTEIVSLLLKAGADPNTETKAHRAYPIHYAAFNGWLDILKLLLDHGANIEAKDSKLMTAFHFAVKRDHEDCVAFLIERGAFVEAKDLKGRTFRDLTTNSVIRDLCYGIKLPQDVLPIEAPVFRRPESPDSVPKGPSDDSREKGASEDSSSKYLNVNGEIIYDEERQLQIYRLLDRYGFVRSTETENSMESSAGRDNSKIEREINRAMKWNDMLTKWSTYSKKHAMKIKVRTEKGIPPRVRGRAWSFLTKSNESLFPERKNLNYQKLLSCDTEHLAQIKKDINRTFPKNILLMQQGGQESLLNVLKAYSVYKKDVGYSQGMGFVTATLLMHLEEEDSFWLLVKLVEDYNMAGLWEPRLGGLPKVFWTFESLIGLYLPRVLSHLRSKDFTPQLYVTQWFVTLFLYSLPFETALRVWDVLFQEGFHYLYAVGLALLKLFENQLLSMNFEQLFAFTKFDVNSPQYQMDGERLLKIANGYKEKVKRSLVNLDKEYRATHQTASGRPSESQ